MTNRPRGGRPNLIKDITTVIDSEERQLGNTYKKTTLIELEKVRRNQRTTKKLAA